MSFEDMIIGFGIGLLLAKRYAIGGTLIGLTIIMTAIKIHQEKEKKKVKDAA